MNKCLQGIYILIFCLFYSVHAQASTTLTEVLETMMEAHANEMLFIGYYLGVDNDSNLQFRYTVDSANQTFNYELLQNQSYLGMNISLSATGTYDQNLSEYTWNSSGVFGNQNWTTAGSVNWIGDPQGTVSTTVTIHGTDYKVTGNVEWEQGPINATSTGKYSFESPGGQTYGPYDGKDQWDIPSMKWKHTVTVPKTPYTPDGIVVFSENFDPLEDGHAGTFSTSITAVPEPFTFALFGFGSLILAASSAVKRKM